MGHTFLGTVKSAELLVKNRLHMVKRELSGTIIEPNIQDIQHSIWEEPTGMFSKNRKGGE